MTSHIHFKNKFDIIQVVSETIAEESLTSTKLEEIEISTIGTSNRPFKVKVTDCVVSSIARPLYLKSLKTSDFEIQVALDCKDCKSYFLDAVQEKSLEISLRVMESLRKKNLPCSCEYVAFDSRSKSIKAYLRTKASLSTQSALLPPPIYLSSFEKLQEVCQREFAVSSSSSPKSVLATWHLYDCIAVAGFDKNHKVGFLFHVDIESYAPKAIKELNEILMSSDKKYSFEYILVGGADTHIQTASKKKQFIESAFKDNSDNKISFSRREYKNKYEFQRFEVKNDSFWSSSVRLCRSIAIDLTQDDPLYEPMSYESILNPNSAYHKLQHTSEEADEILAKLENSIKCVYKG